MIRTPSAVRARFTMTAAMTAGLLVAIALPTARADAQSTPAPSTRVSATAPLSTADLLGVSSVTAGEFSPDGRWLIVRLGKRSDGLTYDASREGDPSYTRPAGARLLLLDTKTGDTTVAIGTPRTIGATAWSRNSARLAITTRDSLPALYLWEATTKKARLISLAATRIAENTELRWTDDDRLVLSVREKNWLPQVSARFDTLVRGPITVQVGADPFLAWDALRRLGNRSLVVALTPATGKLDTLLGATQLNSYTVSRTGRTIAWREDMNAKTNYEGGPTSESRFLARVAGAVPRVVMSSLRGVTLQVADDGEHYAYAKDGALYAATMSDSAARKVIGPAPRAAGDSARAAGADSSARNAQERYTLVRIAPAGDAVVASTRAGLWLVDLASGARRAIATVTDTITGPRVSVAEWTDDGRTLYLAYASRTSWDRALIRVDRTTGAADTLVHDGRLYGAPRLSADGSRMAITIGANGRPSDLWIADGKFGASKRVIESNPQFASRARCVSESCPAVRQPRLCPRSSLNPTRFE